jgi:2-oxoisovalerate dehydrogenase E1 component
MEWYRDDLEEAKSRDPYPVLKQQLLDAGFSENEIEKINAAAIAKVKADYDKALLAEDPQPEDLFTHDFAPTNPRRKRGTQS